MTKKEWSSLRVGHTVYYKSLRLDRSGIKPELVSHNLKGIVISFNSNSSQCKVKFENGVEIWKGRLGIEIDNF
jgi:hypothetical protein